MAGGPNRTLKLSYIGDAKSLNKANQEAESGLTKLGNGFVKFGKIAAGAALAAGAGLLAFSKKAVESAAEAEAAQTRLATILRNTGLATEEQIVALNDQAAALEKVGVASAGNINVLQGQLATFDLTADTIRDLTPAIIDYVIAEKGAAASAGDFQSAANGLAQALQGNFSSLSRVGFVLDDTTKELIANGTEAERTAALVEVLNSTYEGFNEVARETTEGQLVALRNGFDGLKETIGRALLPAFNELIGGVGRIIDRFQELWEIHGPNIIKRFERIKERAGELLPVLRDRLAGAASTLGEIFDGTGEAFGRLATRFAEFVKATAEELTERGVFAETRVKLGDLKLAAEGAVGSFNDFLNSIGRVEAEGSKGFFAKSIEIAYVKPVNDLIDGFKELLRIIDVFFATAARVSEFFQGRGVFGSSASGFGAADLPAGFQAGKAFPSVAEAERAFRNPNPTTVINIQTGIGDPESIAREVERVTQNSTRRSGDIFQTVLGGPALVV